MTKKFSYNPDIHHRRSIRKKGYDYSGPGVYYITICSHNQERLFGTVEKNCMVLNGYGEIVRRTWYDLLNHVGGITLDAFVVMPNHFHGIIIIGDIDVGTEISDVVGNSSDVRAGLEPAPTESMSSTGITVPISPKLPTPPKQHGLPEIVRQLKTFSARRINQMRGTPGVPVWQRNYYERIIRDDIELYHVRQYIMNNPKNWKSDENYYD
ncbi:MAG TPA: transposase [Spirochaetota bacterium]|nr:transposase [Spirochaetota bacterium]HPQ54657.1 transposase [Spirochaetota bacterium]